MSKNYYTSTRVDVEYDDNFDCEFFLANGADFEDSLYDAAKCTAPHEDGSACSPTFDGFVYICLYGHFNK